MDFSNQFVWVNKDKYMQSLMAAMKFEVEKLFLFKVMHFKPQMKLLFAGGIIFICDLLEHVMQVKRKVVTQHKWIEFRGYVQQFFRRLLRSAQRLVRQARCLVLQPDPEGAISRPINSFYVNSSRPYSFYEYTVCNIEERFRTNYEFDQRFIGNISESSAEFASHICKCRDETSRQKLQKYDESMKIFQKHIVRSCRQMASNVETKV